MKKLVPLILAIFLVFAFTADLKADSTKFFGNFGIMTDDSFSFNPFFWSLGINFDFSINDLFMISPEVNVITYEFKFSTFLLEPAVLANFKFGTFFLGAGISKFFVVTGDDFGDSTDIALKINAGFRSENLKFKVYLITPFSDILGSNIVGATFGIGF